MVISGKDVNAKDAVQSVMNNITGICAKENVSVVVKQGMNSTIGAVVNVLAAAKREMNSTIGTVANALNAKKCKINNTNGMVALVASVG